MSNAICLLWLGLQPLSRFGKFFILSFTLDLRGYVKFGFGLGDDLCDNALDVLSTYDGRFSGSLDDYNQPVEEKVFLSPFKQAFELSLID